MTLATKTRLDVRPLTKYIGAEIRGLDLREKPDDETVKAIYQAWLDHLVTGAPTVHATPQQARVTLETTIAIERAAATGKTIRLPLET